MSRSRYFSGAIVFVIVAFFFLDASLLYAQAAADPTDWGSLGLGVGVGVSFLHEPEILDASVENGIVRVKEQEQVRKGIWLETHYLFDAYAPGRVAEAWADPNKKLGDFSLDKRYVSCGPFIGLQVDASGNENLIDSFAIGGLISLKRTPITDSNNSALNFGVGYFWTQVDTLGDRIHANKPLPQGETSIRMKTVDEQGLLIMISFNFLSIHKK